MAKLKKIYLLSIIFVVLSCQNKQIHETNFKAVAHSLQSETPQQTESVTVKNENTSPQRAPAYATFVQDNTNKHIKMFNEIMDSKNDSERLNKFRKLLERQVDTYYFITNKLKKFDSIINDYYQKKQAGEKVNSSDKNQLKKYHLENVALWEFKEKNMDELLKLYNILLVNVHDDNSKYQRESKWILAKIPFWMRASWNKDGDQLPIIEIAEKIHQVNIDFKRKSAKTNSNYFPELNTFLKITAEQYLDAVKKTDDNYAVRYAPDSKASESIQKYWEAYLAKLEDLNVFKTLNDENNQISGNQFASGLWSISFTGGPDLNSTTQIYETLKSSGTPATFFWTGQNLQKYGSLIKNQKDLNISKAISSYSQIAFTEMEPQQVNKEINRSVDDFTRLTGEKPTLFRCPYANCGDLESEAQKNILYKKMRIVSWNVDSYDWHDRNPDLIFERTKKQIELFEGGIISFQESNSQTPVVSKRIIQFLKTKYKIEPLQKLIEEAKN